MNRPIDHSSQRNNLCGAIGLLIVAGLWSALMGSFFCFVVTGSVIGILCTRAQWARIVTLVLAGYMGLVGLLVSLFSRGQASFTGSLAGAMAAAVFWLLLRPGMSDYFSSSPPSAGSRVVPVAPRPGTLSHLQQPPTAAPDSWRCQSSIGPGTDRRSVRPQTANGSTQEQWARLQRQLRAEQTKEEREAASSVGSETQAKRSSFPWLTMIFAVLVFAYATAVGGELGKASLLLVIPGFIAAMVRWIDPRGFLLGVLALSGFLIVRPDWMIVSPEVGVLLHHHGPMIFAAAALLTYLIAMRVSGVAGDCENQA